jgi:hypothetical protein
MFFPISDLRDKAAGIDDPQGHGYCDQMRAVRGVEMPEYAVDVMCSSIRRHADFFGYCRSVQPLCYEFDDRLPLLEHRVLSDFDPDVVQVARLAQGACRTRMVQTLDVSARRISDFDALISGDRASVDHSLPSCACDHVDESPTGARRRRLDSCGGRSGSP